MFLEKVVGDFDQFLVDKDHSFIELEGEFIVDGSKAVKRIPLRYACDREYRNEQLAKLYRLNDWFNSLPANKKVVTLMSLTSYEREFRSYFDQYDFIRGAWLDLKDVMKLELGNFDYLVVAEPQHNGFVHYHVIIFKWITREQANRYQRLWNEKYNAGSYSYGVNIMVKMNDSIRSLKNYLMKYLGKNFSLTYSEEMDKGNEYFEDSDLKRGTKTKGQNKQWNEAGKSNFLKVFHAVKWYMNKRDSEYKGFRAFQPSRNLSKIMALPEVEKNVQVAWYSVSLVIWGVRHLIRKIESPKKWQVVRVGEKNNKESPPVELISVFKEPCRLICGFEYEKSMCEYLKKTPPVDWGTIKRYMI